MIGLCPVCCVYVPVEITFGSRTISLIVGSLGEGSVGSGFDTKVGFDCACPLFCFCEWDVGSSRRVSLMRRGFELFLRACAELSSGVGRWVEGARSEIKVSFVELVRRSYQELVIIICPSFSIHRARLSSIAWWISQESVVADFKSSSFKCPALASNSIRFSAILRSTRICNQ
jgi:hypothetical protein